MHWVGSVRVESDLVGQTVIAAPSRLAGRVLRVGANPGEPTKLVVKTQDGNLVVAEVSEFWVPERSLEWIFARRCNSVTTPPQPNHIESTLIGDTIRIRPYSHNYIFEYYKIRGVVHQEDGPHLLLEAVPGKDERPEVIASVMEDGKPVHVAGFRNRLREMLYVEHEMELDPVRVETDLIGRIVWDTFSGRVGRVLWVAARPGKPITLAVKLEGGEELTAEARRFLVPESRLEPLLGSRLEPASGETPASFESEFIGKSINILTIIRTEGLDGYFPYPGRYRARAVFSHGQERRLLVEVLRDAKVCETHIKGELGNDGKPLRFSGRFRPFREVEGIDWEWDIMQADEPGEDSSAFEDEASG